MEGNRFFGDGLEVQEIGDVTVARFLHGYLENSVLVEETRDAILSLVKRLVWGKLLLNFENVEFLSSNATVMLFNIGKRAGYAHARVILCNVDERVKEIVEITGLSFMFTICRNVQDGLERFAT